MDKDTDVMGRCGRLVITVETLQDAIRFINARPRPLAAYIFSRNPVSIDMVHAPTVRRSCYGDTMTLTGTGGVWWVGSC